MHKHILPALALSISACNQLGTKDPISEVCTPVPGEPCLGDDGSADESTDEVGADSTDSETGQAAPAELGPNECVHNITDEFAGYRMQCEGELFTTLEFGLPFGFDCDSSIGPDLCQQHHVFGPSNDLYEAPDVMACCGEEWDHQYLDTYLLYCSYDVIQQACSSLAKRLEAYIVKGAFGDHTAQATALQSWIAGNYPLCFDSLLQNDSDPDPRTIVSHWSIPNHAAWSAIDDMVLHVDTGTESTGVFRPASTADWIPCNGANENNDEIFEDAAPSSGGILVGVGLGADVEGELLGPSIFGGSVSASAMFNAQCLPQGCPKATFSHDPEKSQFIMEDLNLYTESFSVSNGTSALAVERARIELWSHAEGFEVYDASGQSRGYEIPAGAARFLIAGVADDVYNQFIGINSTAIGITVQRGEWQIDSFALEYEDGSGLWRLELEESMWQ